MREKNLVFIAPAYRSYFCFIFVMIYLTRWRCPYPTRLLKISSTYILTRTKNSAIKSMCLAYMRASRHSPFLWDCNDMRRHEISHLFTWTGWRCGKQLVNFVSSSSEGNEMRRDDEIQEGWMDGCLGISSQASRRHALRERIKLNLCEKRLRFQCVFCFRVLNGLGVFRIKSIVYFVWILNENRKATCIKG